MIDSLPKEQLVESFTINFDVDTDAAAIIHCIVKGAISVER